MRKELYLKFLAEFHRAAQHEEAIHTLADDDIERFTQFYEKSDRNFKRLAAYIEWLEERLK